MSWRVGSKVPLNVYDGERPVCQCHNAEYARLIVDVMNAAAGVAILDWGTSCSETDHFHRIEYMEMLRAALKKQEELF